MKVLIITYDLIAPDKNYESLLKRIKSHGQWSRLGGSSYLIYTAKSPEEVRNYLMEVLDSNDQLFVGVAPAPSAWYNLPPDVAQWIHDRQT